MLQKCLTITVFKHMDLREFENYVCYTLTHRIRYGVYAPYWLEHCKTEGGITTNDLIGMTWDPETHVWEKALEDGRYTWATKLPPTREEIEKGRRMDLENYETWKKEIGKEPK